MRAGYLGTVRAKALRRDATEAEKHLWNALRQLRPEWHFRRQHPVVSYTVDFARVRARLVVEADGGQHNESADDAARDHHLKSKGWTVLRFWNNEILSNRDGVMSTIIGTLEKKPLPSR